MRTLATLFLTLTCISCAAVPEPSGPRLAVVISFDQMRGDMLKRFDKFFGPNGFKRVQREGTNHTKCYFEHANLMTGPGHAVLLTGAYPKTTGVTTNDLCSRSLNECFYCAADTDGTPSAFPLKVSTVGDELRAKDARSKVFGIATKDRAAILMSGHNPSGAIWLDYRTGMFTTSVAYQKPEWVHTLAHKYSLYRFADSTWRARIPIELDPAHDLQPWEGKLSDGTNTFPYIMGDPGTMDFMKDILATPYSAQVVFDAAVDIIDEEQLGADGTPDILTIGISTTDFTGHLFGPDSREVQELYHACDEMLATFIDALDVRVGRDNYVLFITSDHGVAPIPESLNQDVRPREPRIDAGRIPGSHVTNVLDSALTQAYGEAPSGSWVWEQHLPSVYLDRTAMKSKGIDLVQAQSVAAEAIKQLNGIGVVVTHEELIGGSCPPFVSADVCTYIQNAFDPDRSGDLLVYPKRYWVFGSKPATHGTFHDYDRWVPLVVMGAGIPSGEVTTTVAPTKIAEMLRSMYGLSR